MEPNEPTRPDQPNEWTEWMNRMDEPNGWMNEPNSTPAAWAAATGRPAAHLFRPLKKLSIQFINYSIQSIYLSVYLAVSSVGAILEETWATFPRWLLIAHADTHSHTHTLTPWLVWRVLSTHAVKERRKTKKWSTPTTPTHSNSPGLASTRFNRRWPAPFNF